MSRARKNDELEVQPANPARVTRQFRFDLSGLGEGPERLARFEV